MTKAELEKKLNTALKEANSAIKSINNSSLPYFSPSMETWARIIDENADTNSGEEEWKRIKKRSKDDIAPSIHRIKHFNYNSAEGHIYISSSETF